jgi:hypothetical protein
MGVIQQTYERVPAAEESAAPQMRELPHLLTRLIVAGLLAVEVLWVVALAVLVHLAL